MSEPHPELLILVVTLVALALAPLSARLVGRIGEQISSEVDGGRSGEDLQEHLDAGYEGSLRDDEIAQMLAAREFLRGERARDAEAQSRPVPGPDAPGGPDDAELREEVRQLVIASNERRARAGEPPLDVDAEVVRRLAAVLGANGGSRT